MTKRLWLLTGALCLMAWLARADNAPPSVTLIDLQGTVQVRDSDQDPWKNAEERQSILSGETVRTGAASSAHLRVANAGLLQLTANTTIQIKPSVLLTFKVHQGVVVGRVIPKPPGPSGRPVQMEFQTPTAVAGIRGTEFAVQTQDPDDSDVGVFDEGHVEVESLDSAGNPTGAKVELGPGQETAAQAGQAPSAPHPLAMLLQYRENVALLRARLQSLQRERRDLLSEKRQQLREALDRQKNQP